MIAKEALRVTCQLEEINSHHETPAQALGMTVGVTHEAQTALSSLEHQHITELPDGSHLYRMDQGVYAMIREGLAPGSLLETGLMRSISKQHEQIQAFLAFAPVAIVLRHEPQRTVLMGFARNPRLEEQQKGIRQGAWGEYFIDGKKYKEKDDARMGLLRLFSTEKGIEGSQMLSMLFQTSMLTGNGNETKISEAGCFSHEKPLQAIPINLLHGIATPFPIELRPDDGNRIIRVCVARQLDRFEPLYTTEAIDEEHILSMGLITRAEQIAKQNPTNMGAGTPPERVLAAMLETTIQLPELVGNGATMKAATDVLKNNLGIR